MDYSCYIKVINKLDDNLYLSHSEHSYGDWVEELQQTILPSTSYPMELKDKVGFYGAEGSLTYSNSSSPSKNSVIFTTNFGCPFSGDNYVRNSVNNPHLFQVTYRAKAGDGAWLSNDIPKSGHPLYIEYTLGYVNISTSTFIKQITIRGDYTIQNSVGKIISYSDPIWSYNQNYNDGDFSTNPGLLKIGNVDAMTLTLHVDESLNGVFFSLQGYQGTRKVASSEIIIGSIGDQLLPVTLIPPMSVPHQLAGDIQWKLTIIDSGQEISLEKMTRLELYWIYDKPGSMYSKGAWVTVLRHIFGHITIYHSQSDVVSSIVDYCFRGVYDGSPKKYASTHGAPQFGTSAYGGYINLKLYYSNRQVFCNCYDQAGIVQVSLAALGISSTWAYLRPCGFINQTNLIGWGPCNNPFFKGNRAKMIVDINDPKRTLFGNHAFIIWSSKAIDACQGPYTATSSVAQYISAIIDTVTTLYPTRPAPYNRPGTVSNVQKTKGITSVERMSVASFNMDSPEVKAILQIIDTQALTAEWDKRYVQVNWESVPAALFTGQHVQSGYRQVVLARDGALLIWIGNFSNLQVRIDAFIAVDGVNGALNRMLDYLTSVSMPLEEAVIQGPANLGPTSIAFPGIHPQILWINRNIFLRIETDESDEGNDSLSNSLAMLAERLNDLLEAGVVPPELLSQPQIGELRASMDVVKVGEQVLIDVGVEDLLVEVDIDGEALQIESIEKGVWRFRAVAPGDVWLVFSITDSKSLNVINRPVRVRVQ